MPCFVRFSCGVAALLLCGALHAADNAGTSGRKVSIIPSANAAPTPGHPDRRGSVLVGDPLIFSAPPRESAEEAYRLYRPVAEYLAGAIGHPVAYVYPKTWLSYQKEMARGAYDIVFDDAHFTSWRISNLNHTALARIPEQQVFVVVTRKDSSQVGNLKQLAGKRVCAMGASNLATLTLLAEFDPMRQPLVVEHVGWSKVYDGVIEGRCTAATLPRAVLSKLDAGNLTRVVHQSKPLPNQAFSAGTRLTAEDQLKLAKALTSADGTRVLEPLLAASGTDRGLTPAAREEFSGMDAYLKDIWGYAR